MKKILKITLCLMVSLTIFASTIYATVYNYDSFSTPENYGTKTKIDENITNLNGNRTETGEKLQGPYSKASTAKLADGITEETYIELDLDKFAEGEYFEVSLALKNMKDGAEQYITEQVIMTQKSNGKFILTANGIPNFRAEVDKSGVYTYRWNMYTDVDGITYERFSLYNHDTLVATTGVVNLDNITGSDTKTPVAAQGDVSVKYLWFVHINVANGVNVYAELPALPGENPPAETPVTEETPQTGLLDIALYAGLFIALISLGGIITIKNITRKR